MYFLLIQDNIIKNLRGKKYFSVFDISRFYN